MTTFSIVYIDDDKDEDKGEKIKPLVRGLTSQKKIDFTLEYPEKLEDYVRKLSVNYSDSDGYLLDLRLNENHAGKENYATYPAQILAAAIRTYQNGDDKLFNEVPIFLISSYDKKKDFYDTDTSSHDLFDLFISKNDLADNGKTYENQMSSIVLAYKAIDSKKNLHELFAINEEEFGSLNINFDCDNQLVSIISQFIFREIILRTGVLINEDILAARLGIDNRKSPDDWAILLKEINKDCIYNGVFSEAWERWWTFKLLDWWENNISKDLNLINLKAEERVKLIKEKYGLKQLEVAKPIDKGMSTCFWTICQAYNLPIDNYDGFLINKKNEIWQDKEYVSPKAVYEGVSKGLGIKLHPDEKERYDELKTLYKKKNYGDK